VKWKKALLQKWLRRRWLILRVMLISNEDIIDSDEQRNQQIQEYLDIDKEAYLGV
jgi:hypothetical protein